MGGEEGRGAKFCIRWYVEKRFDVFGKARRVCAGTYARLRGHYSLGIVGLLITEIPSLIRLSRCHSIEKSFRIPAPFREYRQFSMIGPRRAQYAPKSIKFRSIPRGGQCLAKPCLHYCCRFSPIAHRFHRLRVRASREQVDQDQYYGNRTC